MFNFIVFQDEIEKMVNNLNEIIEKETSYEAIQKLLENEGMKFIVRREHQFSMTLEERTVCINYRIESSKLSFMGILTKPYSEMNDRELIQERLDIIDEMNYIEDDTCHDYSMCMLQISDSDVEFRKRNLEFDEQLYRP